MMDMITLWLGERLLLGSIQAFGLVSIVWLICRLAPRVPAAAQAALWWLVALKLVLVFAPAPTIQLPVLPATFEHQMEPPRAIAAVADTHARTSPSNRPLQGLLLIWLVAVVFQAGRLVVAHRQLRRTVARSERWPDEEIRALSTRIGLRRVPQVRISEEIDSPQVFGLWSPVVLLPAGTMTAISEDERSMTLCHELMHIRRRDLLFGWVPACAERLFFFHPLARLSAREYVCARESACDAATVRALGVEADDYGRMLVRLGIGNTRPALSVGGSSFSTSSLKRRLEMLESRRFSTLSRGWRWAIAVIAAVVIPMQLVARTPEAPQVSGPGARPDRFLNPSKAEQELAQLRTSKEIELEIRKIKAEKLRAVTDGEKEKDKVKDIHLKVAKLVEQSEQDRGAQEKGERAKVEEMMALIAKAREATARANNDVPQQLRRLAEQLERLAVEQRQLAEEIRRMQPNSPDR